MDALSFIRVETGIMLTCNTLFMSESPAKQVLCDYKKIETVMQQLGLVHRMRVALKMQHFSQPDRLREPRENNIS